jgi:hypothetical protein
MNQASVSDNLAAGGSGFGGGCYLASGASLAVTGSSIVRNEAAGRIAEHLSADGVSSGGGVYTLGRD